jgi:hypothetical protein
MRKVLIGLVGVCVLLVGVTAAAQTQTGPMTLQTALGYFKNDSIMIPYSDQGKAQLEGIIAALRTALGVPATLDETNEDQVEAFSVDPSLKDVATDLSQAYYTLANVFTPEGDQEPIYLKGKNWGFKSLRMDPNFNDLSGGRFDTSVAQETDVAALYWTNSNWLRVAQKHPMQAVFAGVPKKTQLITERLMQLDPDYLVGGPYRAYAAYWSGLPIGKDLNKTLQYICYVVDQPSYCASCDITNKVPDASGYFENRTFFVEFYLMPKKQWKDAEAILESVINAPIGDTYPLMNAYSQARAKDLLAEVQSHLQ